MRPRLERGVKLASLKEVANALYHRIEEAEKMLPLPDAAGNVPQNNVPSEPPAAAIPKEPLDVVTQKGRAKRAFTITGIGKRG